jgi:glycerol-3-phosphate dehydrogenase
VEAKTDQRPFFILPWNGRYLIGTTDIRYDGDLDDVRIDAQEIDYLLRETNAIFPAVKLRRDQILYTYSGIRPLPFTSETDEPSITRRHFLRPDARYKSLFSIVGGKLTTYRSLSEEAVDLVFEKLGRSAPACLTAEEPLGAPANPIRTSPLTARLSRLYGGRSDAIRDLVKEDAALGEIFDPETGGVAAEVVYAFRYEFARTLADCLLRRTMVGLNSSLGVGADEAAAKVAVKYLGWSEQRARDEVGSYRKFIERFRV